jgi:hypothetical protein
MILLLDLEELRDNYLCQRLRFFLEELCERLLEQVRLW